MNESKRTNNAFRVEQNPAIENSLDELTPAPVRSVNELQTLENLGKDFTKNRAYEFFQKELENGKYTLEELVLEARKVSKIYPKCNNASTKDHWQELHNALDANGYIRHDFNEQDFHTGKLLRAVFKSPTLSDGTLIVDGIGSFNSNEQYETHKSISDNQLQKIIDEVKIKVSDREYFLLVNWCGLDNNEPHTLTAIGKTLNLSEQRVCQIKDVALKKLRHYATDHLEIIYRYDETELPEYIQVIEEKIERLKSRKTEQEDELDKTTMRIKRDIAKTNERIKKEVEKIHTLATLPYHSTKNLWYKYKHNFTEDAFPTDIDNLGLTIRARNRLRRMEIKTLDDIMIQSRKHCDGSVPDYLLKIDGLGKKSLKNILSVLRKYGYDVPDPETI